MAQADWDESELLTQGWTDVGQIELREFSDPSETSGGLRLGLVLCAPWGTADHARPGVHTPETTVCSSTSSRRHPLPWPCQWIPTFIGIFLWFGFFLQKNICYWFSPVLKFCPVEMLSCFHLCVTLPQSFPFFSVHLSPPPAVCLSERHTPQAWTGSWHLLRFNPNAVSLSSRCVLKCA